MVADPGGAGPGAGPRRARLHRRSAREKLVGDITYIPTGEGWLYLATVIDCCTKEVIGYAMDDHYQTPLISRAIRNAARNRRLAQDAIFHSDRGSNYMSAEYAGVLRELGLRRSACRTGICFDCQSFRTGSRKDRVAPAEAV
ncbi:DDE-type integrase/transposase/recombinase [Streptomyces sp. GD-15H]|uniref:DDE-type integrase/transposase/recombinase n=1 Tax=Streptomyces sp. GD-15H TaxID=3129112 RepID=UPI003245AFFC